MIIIPCGKNGQIIYESQDDTPIVTQLDEPRKRRHNVFMRTIRFILLALLVSILSGCAGVSPTPTPFQLYQGPTAVLPTPVLPTPVLPTSTRVMASPWTPTPIPTPTPFPGEVLALVTNVPTADTLEVVMQGDLLNQVYTVRLLGIVSPAPGVPWGNVAFNTLKRRLNGQVVRLVQDNTAQNNDGELPRYVYLGETLINFQLIEMGLADVLFAAPDTRLQAEFSTAANTAREQSIGVWGPDPTATPAFTATSVFTVTATISATAVITGTPAITPTTTETP